MDASSSAYLLNVHVITWFCSWTIFVLYPTPYYLYLDDLQICIASLYLLHDI